MEENKEISVKDNIQQVNQDLLDLQSSGRDYKKYIETTRGEIVSMEAKTELLIRDTPKSFMPQIEELFSDLKNEITRQSNMNEFLQKQITELKKERSILSQHIIGSNTSVSILQDKVGYTSKYS
jgi:predicted  nucleic acid-binding Zn-ribbon protein